MDMTYDEWKQIVFKNVYKILRISVDKITISLLPMFMKNFHPYTTSIIAVLHSKEYRAGLVYHSFVIPHRDELIIHLIT